MTDDQVDELARAERAGRLLIAHLKRLNVSEIKMPILDDTSMWVVSVERVRILENDGVVDIRASSSGFARL